jgi:uncharacterized protein (TIGR04222 family)
MDFLTNNPIANLPGPQFLVFYFIVAVAGWVLCFMLTRRSDRTLDIGPLPLPAEVDPFELAYLRGGPGEVKLVILLDLIQRGYVREQKPKGWARFAPAKLEISPDRPAIQALSEIELDMLKALAFPQPMETILNRNFPTDRLNDRCLEYERRLQAEDLVLGGSGGEASLNSRVLVPVVLGLMALAGYKFAVALSRGRHNVGFLIALTIVAVVVSAVCCTRKRLTARGRDYLARLRSTLEGIRTQAKVGLLPSLDPNYLLLASAFGVGALAGTALAGETRLLRSMSASGTSSTDGGGGCGGGGCGGGGCGGGCGGCGG